MILFSGFSPRFLAYFYSRVLYDRPEVRYIQSQHVKSYHDGDDFLKTFKSKSKVKLGYTTVRSKA